MMGERPPPRPRPDAATPPAWLEVIRARVHADFRGSLRVATLAAEVGVHPVHAARVFRRHYGRTITQYVHDLRIEHARRAIASGVWSLASIAYDNGFSDQAHFTRRFKERVGVSPGVYRALATDPLERDGSARSLPRRAHRGSILRIREESRY